MDEFGYFLIRVVSIFLDVLSLALLLRALMSWFVQDGENTFVNFLYMATEPVILPIRALCAVFHWFEGVPIDMPFLITVCSISFFRLFLSGMAA